MEKLSISAIKEELKVITSADDPRLAGFRLDTRKGVQLALTQWQKQQDKQAALVEKYQEMSILNARRKLKGFEQSVGLMKSVAVR